MVSMMNPTTNTEPQNRKFILVGEDDMDDKEIIEEAFLEIEPAVKVCFVNSGKEFLSFLGNPETCIPSLIVLDYNMPGLNGAEILKELEPMTRIKEVPKLIWSTSGASLYKNSCLALGATDYLLKPSNIDELEKTIRYMLSLITVT